MNGNERLRILLEEVIPIAAAADLEDKLDFGAWWVEDNLNCRTYGCLAGFAANNEKLKTEGLELWNTNSPYKTINSYYSVWFEGIEGFDALQRFFDTSSQMIGEIFGDEEQYDEDLDEDVVKTLEDRAEVIDYLLQDYA